MEVGSGVNVNLPGSGVRVMGAWAEDKEVGHSHRTTRGRSFDCGTIVVKAGCQERVQGERIGRCCFRIEHVVEDQEGRNRGTGTVGPGRIRQNPVSVVIRSADLLCHWLVGYTGRILSCLRLYLHA